MNNSVIVLLGYSIGTDSQEIILNWEIICRPGCLYELIECVLLTVRHKQPEGVFQTQVIQDKFRNSQINNSSSFPCITLHSPKFTMLR